MPISPNLPISPILIFLEIKHNLETSKRNDATNSNYKKEAQLTNSKNEYTKSFCKTEEYQRFKKNTEITRDSIYQEHSFRQN